MSVQLVCNDGGSITTYNYSSRGELLSATLPDSRVISYENDPLGRRIAKRVNGTNTEKYLWKGLTQLLAVYDGSNNLLMRFEYADGRLPVSVMTSSGRQFLFYDQVGSLKAVANNAGLIVKQIEYDSFGNILSDSNSGLAVPFGFAGGLNDRDTGLVRFGHRDYDPGIGRWTAKDPIFFAGGDVDLYGYVENNPINFIDPFGLKNWGQIAGGIATTIGGAVTAVAGAAVVGLGAAEATTGVGALFSLHTIGAGGMLIGAGITTSYFGLKMIIEGWNDEDWDDRLKEVDQSPDMLRACPVG